MLLWIPYLLMSTSVLRDDNKKRIELGDDRKRMTTKKRQRKRAGEEEGVCEEVLIRSGFFCENPRKETHNLHKLFFFLLFCVLATSLLIVFLGFALRQAE